MSATFPGTSTYPKKSYYCGSEIDPKMPEGKMKIANQKHAKALAKFRGVKSETIKWQDEKGQFLPVEVSTDERFRFGKTLIFVRDINITPEQDFASHSLPLIKISVKPFLLVVNSDPVSFFLAWQRLHLPQFFLIL